MPLYEFLTESGEVIEEIFPHDKRPDFLKNPVTGEVAMFKISGHAYTPNAWGVDWRRGVKGSGRFDRGLGMTVYSDKHVDEELAKRGWVRESQVGALTVERANSAYEEDATHQNKRADEFAALNAKYGVDINNIEINPDTLKRTEMVMNEFLPAHVALSEEN